MKIFKSIAFVAVFLALGCFGSLLVRSTASQTPSVHCAVMLNARQNFGSTNITIYLSSSSVGAPAVPEGTGLGDAIALFLNEGYRVEHMEGLNVLMIK